MLEFHVNAHGVLTHKTFFAVRAADQGLARWLLTDVLSLSLHCMVQCGREVGKPGHQDSRCCNVRGCQSFRLKFGLKTLQGVLQGHTWLHNARLLPDRTCGHMREVSRQFHDGTEVARQSACDLPER